MPHAHECQGRQLNDWGDMTTTTAGFSTCNVKGVLLHIIDVARALILVKQKL